MADNILDREKHPEWQGERTKMVYVFPTNEKLWAQYAEIRADSLRNDGDLTEATEFYRQNRTAIDAGAVIAWPQRHNTDELSAIQNAMNLKFRDEAAFFAEYQNEPIQEKEGEGQLTADEIEAIKFLIETPAMQGVFNLMSPEPQRNRHFCEILAETLKKKRAGFRCRRWV